MESYYTAAIQRDGSWWIGWVLEVPGVNSKGQPGKSLLKISVPPSTKPSK